MSATNKTPNIELPQFIGSDIPGWLTDFNSAMLKIDTAVGNAKTESANALSAAESAATKADASLSVADQAMNSADDANANIEVINNTISELNTKVENIGSETKENSDQFTEMESRITSTDPPSAGNISTWISRVNGRINNLETNYDSLKPSNTNYNLLSPNPSTDYFQSYLLNLDYLKNIYSFSLYLNVMFNAGKIFIGEQGVTLFKSKDADREYITNTVGQFARKCIGLLPYETYGGLTKTGLLKVFAESEDGTITITISPYKNFDGEIEDTTTVGIEGSLFFHK